MASLLAWHFFLSGGNFGVGRFGRGEELGVRETRFSPSRSPFPGTQLFCVVVMWKFFGGVRDSAVLVVERCADF